jgi:hypothetical protein
MDLQNAPDVQANQHTMDRERRTQAQDMENMPRNSSDRQSNSVMPRPAGTRSPSRALPLSRSRSGVLALALLQWLGWAASLVYIKNADPPLANQKQGQL